MDPRGDHATFEDNDPEDILSASLQSLYGLSPITFSTAGSIFVYRSTRSGQAPGCLTELKRIELATPDTEPSNWSLHASSIWVSSLFIADHLEELHINAIADLSESDGTPQIVRILELGAGAGLPSILLASTYENVSVTVTDYPDDRLMRTLSDNVRRNGVGERCRVVPYAWGTNVRVLAEPPFPDHTIGDRSARVRPEAHYHDARFDIIFAADTLWNPELHASFINTLCMCLKHHADSRIHLVAGLHTGRYTIQSFLGRVEGRGLLLESVTEREVGGMQSRPWDVSRAEGEDERERRRWVVWMVLKWGDWARHDEKNIIYVEEKTS